MYTVWLVEGHRGRNADTMVLACERDVYCDTLQGVIEAVYDQAIRATRDLIHAGRILRIELVDHVIVGRSSAEPTSPWVSLRALGYFA